MTSHSGTGTRRRPLILRVWGNPLARGVDRTEAAFVLALIVVCLLSLPLIATIGSVEWTSTHGWRPNGLPMCRSTR